MSEYIVDVGDADEKHVQRFNTQATSLFGHPIKEQVVRCRDCRFCGKGSWGAETFPVCRRGIHAFQVSNEGFCAWGKRRDT